MELSIVQIGQLLNRICCCGLTRKTISFAFFWNFEFMDLNDKSENRPNVQSLMKNRPQVLYSPRAVAKAIGVSESSLKRWCDSGKIAAIKTAGGHRRVNRGAVIEFLRGKKYELQDPSAIGLPSLDDTNIDDSADAADQLFNSLVEGDSGTANQILIYLFVNGWMMEEIIDQIVSVAFTRIGSKWEHGNLEVYQERRACEICLNTMREIRLMLSPPKENALKAIGATIEGDHYALPTFSVEITLATYGWNASSIGSNVPLNSLLQAVRDQSPDLVWLSASHLEDGDRFVEAVNNFAVQVPESTTFVVGGYAIKPSFRPRIKGAICCDNLSQLVASIKHLKPKPPAPPSSFPPSPFGN